MERQVQAAILPRQVPQLLLFTVVPLEEPEAVSKARITRPAATAAQAHFSREDRVHQADRVAQAARLDRKLVAADQVNNPKRRLDRLAR